ncbi:ATP-binding cassette sub-family B member 9 isoform X1 [Latimeria chalumnae]|uniref:ATP-binding cassette sub-family B member 9 isoform X1 n=1 Tax=Latimeria chalumnae TaxID=7897 RepID=UPI00313AA31F
MRAWKAILCTLLFIILDLTITTLLYIHGSNMKKILLDITHFDIFHSTLDIWGMSLLRVCLLLGGAVGVAKNTTHGPKRLRASKTFIIIIASIISIYATVKFLLYSEVVKSMNDPWLWCLFMWTYLTLLATFFLWELLSSVTPLRQNFTSMESGCLEEKESLLNAHSDNCKDSKKKEVPSGAAIYKLLSYTKPDMGLLGIALFFLLISTLGETFIPFYTGLAVDGIVIQKNMEAFAKAMMIMTLLAVGSSFAAGVRGGIFTLTFARLNVRIRNLLFRSLMHQEIGFFDSNHTGDITSRLTSDTTIVSDLISQNMNIFLRSAVKAAGVCVFMLSLSWQLSLVTFIGFPIIILVSEMYGKYYKKLAKEVQDALAKANHIAEETISAMKTVRSFANEDTEANFYFEKLQQMYKLNKTQALAYAFYMWSNSLAQLALQVSILFYGGHLVISGHMTSGNLISFIIYKLVLAECMENIGSVYTGLMQGVGAAEKVFAFIDRKPIMSSDGTLAPESLKGQIEFRNVTFAYPTRPETEVLKNVSFTLRPGEVTALVGPSGSGKSSCVNLLEIFYTPQSGEILLDGKPIKEYNHTYFHSKVSLVSQEPVLFARSITENITYGLSSCSSDSVVQASQKANAHGFITELQDGYHTETGEKGAQLSGGQKQRVAIARALIREPQVLILDEATSALDAESEHVVQQALNSIMQNRTVLVIAHRLSTVENAHNIIVLDKGHVVEQGTHKQLLQREGLYSKLVQRQILGLKTGTEEKGQSALSHGHDVVTRSSRRYSSDSSDGEFKL